MTSPVARVLQILLLLKQGNTNNSISQVMEKWGVDTADLAQVARLRAFLIDEVCEAEMAIKSGAVPGAAAQLLPTLEVLKRTFSGDMFSTNIGSIPALEATIAAFSVIVDVAGLTTPARPSAIGQLLASIEELIAEFAAADIDPTIRETALSHLRVLAVILNHVEAFGVDAARREYASLIVRLNSAARGKPEAAKKAGGLVAKLRRIGIGLKEADEAFEHGTSLIDHAGEVLDLLT
jgi:hypothetical protein